MAEVRNPIIIEPAVHSETRTKRGTDQTGAGGGSDHGEFWQIESHASSVGTLINNDVEAEIFHGRVEIFFDGDLKAVNLVNKENIPAFESRQDAGEISGPFDHRTAGRPDIDFHGVG